MTAGGSMVASRVISIPTGQIATVVTCLEMREPPAQAVPPRSALKLERWAAPIDLVRYRNIFRSIGQPWLWRGRLVLADAELASTLGAATLEIYVAIRRDGTPQGLLELDFSTENQCELAYFGLVPEMTGRGHGDWLMAHALKRAWAGQAGQPGIARVWVHTCDLDHPAAPNFYRRHGFRPYERLVEIFDDPRASGLYPADCAPGAALL